MTPKTTAIYYWCQPWCQNEKKVRGFISLTFAFDGGRYKIRTCDPIRVKDMLYP